MSPLPHAAALPLLADSGIPLWPVNSFTMLFGGFLLVAVVLIVSAVILARVQRAEKERRLDAQIEEARERRKLEAAEQAAATVLDKEQPPAPPEHGPRGEG